MPGLTCSGVALTADGSTVIRCKICGFSHIVPLPVASDSVAFHEDKFFDELKPAYRASHERDREWWDLVHGMRLARIERAIGRVGRLLDIGSGFGDLVSRADAGGWRAEGLEPSRSAARWANENGRLTHRAPISSDATRGLGLFDAVVFDQSIEHIADPRQAIADALEILVDDGVVCVVFANDFSAVQQAASLRTQGLEWWVVPAEHVNYFDLAGMQHLLESLGLVPIDVIGSFPIDLFLCMGYDYVKDSDLGRDMHERRMLLEFSFRDSGRLSDLEEAYRGLGRAGFGREIEIIATRKK